MNENTEQNNPPANDAMSGGNFDNLTRQEKSHPDLYKKTVKGGVWMFSGRIYQQVLSLVRLLILAKLLAPREFGVLGISMLVMQILETFTQTGFIPALIQKKQDNVHDFLNTAWTVNIIRGVVLFAILFFTAPIALLYFDGNGVFKENDFSRPVELVRKLQTDTSDLAVYINSNIPGELKDKLNLSIQDKPDLAGIRKLLTDVFNTLTQKESIYTPQRFEGVVLSDYARSLLLTANTEKIQKNNRLLLEQAWPDLLSNSILDLPQVTLIVRVMGLLLIIRSFANVATLYFSKDLLFHKQVILQIVGTTAGVFFSIVLAFWLKNVWALVFGSILTELLNLFISYYLEPYSPRIELNWGKMQQMWSYGRWISGLTILDFFISKLDSLIVGRVAGVTSLGLYQMAGTLSGLPTTQIAQVISSVTFPAYCKIQNEHIRLKKAFFKTNEMIIIMTLPWLGLFIALGEDAVRLFLNDNNARWIPMIGTLQILSLWGIICTIGVGGGAIFQSLGKPHYLTVLAAVKISLLAAVLYPLVNLYGINGAAFAVLISTSIAMIPGYIALCRVLKCSYPEIFLYQAPGLLSVLVMMLMIFGIKQWLWDNMSLLRFVVLGLSGTVVYFVLCFKITAHMNGQAMNTFLILFQKFRDWIESAVERHEN